MSTPADPAIVTLAARLDTTAGEICGAIKQMAERLDRAERPPTRHVKRLTPATFRVQDQSGDTHYSLGVRNNGNVSVYVGIGGESPQANSGALQVHAGTVVTIPTLVRDVEIGIDPADIDDVDVDGFVVELYRFWTVQPLAQYGSGGASGGDGVVDGGTP